MDHLGPSAESFTSAARFATSLTLAALTILFYDFALTVTTEIEYYWSPPSLSPSFILYAISRYFGLLGHIPVFFEYFGELSEHRWAILIVVVFCGSHRVLRCRQLQVYHQAYAIMSQAIVAVLLILRTYALYMCNKRMLVLLVVSYVGIGVQSLGAVLTSKTPLTNASDAPLGFAYTGCNLALTNNQGVHLALGWSAMLWFDALIFGLTFYKAIQVRRDISGGLLVTVFRDGTVYFAILVAVNMVNIITFLVTPSNTPLKGMATTLTNVLSVTLTSRLMLNLRDPSAQRQRRNNATTRYEGWSTGQVSSRGMSFRHPTMPNDTFTLNEMGNSFGTDSSV